MDTSTQGQLGHFVFKYNEYLTLYNTILNNKDLPLIISADIEESQSIPEMYPQP